MKGYVFYDSWNNTQATQAAMRLQREGKYEAALESYCKALEIDSCASVKCGINSKILPSPRFYRACLLFER